MFCPQTLKAQYVAFCRGHFSLYICLASSSLGGWGGGGMGWETWEGGIAPPISALITPTTDPSNHCLGVGRSCSLVGGILSGSPTIVSILDLLRFTSITISVNAERYKTSSVDAISKNWNYHWPTHSLTDRGRCETHKKNRNTKMQKPYNAKSSKSSSYWPTCTYTTYSHGWSPGMSKTDRRVHHMISALLFSLN